MVNLLKYNQNTCADKYFDKNKTLIESARD